MTFVTLGHFTAHFLRFIQNDNGIVGCNHINGAAGTELVTLGVDDSGGCVTLAALHIFGLVHGGCECLDIDNHYINPSRGGEGIQLVQVGAVVNEETVFLLVVLHEVFRCILKGLVYALTNGNAGNHHNELAPTVLFVQLKETIPAKVRERGVNYYNWCKDKNVDSDLISEMKQQINRTRRDLDKCDLSSFINNYRKYLIQQFPDSAKKDNLAFWEAYKEAYSYFMQEDSAEQFEQKIRKELTAFAINIFEDLENADTLELEYTGFVKTNAASSFAEYMLAGIHRDILVIIHKPLWILKVVNSYRYFLNNTDMHPGAKVFLQSTVASFLDKRPEYSHEKECQDYLVSVFKKIDAITNQIQKCYQELSIKYPELESDGFKDDYLKACKIFRDVKKDYLLLIAEKNEIGGILCEKDSLSPDKHYKKLFAASNILRIACKYVVAVEIEKAVPQLVERYCELRRRIKE